MSWLDDLLGKIVMLNGVAVPDRKRLNFVGSGLSVQDNPSSGTTDVTIGTSNVGKDPLEPQSGGGYPSNSSRTIGTGSTFVRNGAADGDSVRFFGAGGSEPGQSAFMQGRVTNLSGYVLSLYPLPTQHLYLNGVDLGAGVSLDISVGATIFWCLDDALDAHITA